MSFRKDITHSVILDYEKCKGCTACMRICPMEAIRVYNEKAKIIEERCIDCGECIKVCPYKAKRAVCDSFQGKLEDYRWTIALPAPALYGQFSKLDDVDFILTGLINMGFNQVFEVAQAAEIISFYTSEILKKEDCIKPVISCACPTIIRFISTKFPELLDNILPLIPPVNLAARIARKEAVIKTGYRPEEIGVFFISPCPAKVTDGKNPLTVKNSGLDGIFGIKEIYRRLLEEMNKITIPLKLSISGVVGRSWAYSGGEASAQNCERYLSADGIDNVTRVLEEIGKGKLQRTEFVELNACTGGCVGGALNVENPFIAKARIIKQQRYSHINQTVDLMKIDRELLNWENKVSHNPIMLLDEDIFSAIKKMNKMEEILKELPGLDCGACGAPTCRALAEDIVRGVGSDEECIFNAI